MTAAQKKLRELRERQSKERGRMAELGMLDELNDEQRAELDGIEKGTPDLERQIRAATVAVEDEDKEAREQAAATAPTPEQRERIQLRSRASVGRYLLAALRSRAPDGAEAELQQAAGVDGIPFELWQPPEQRQTEDRAVTGAPSTTGVNLDTLRPHVFAPSIVDKLMVQMPEVESGIFATGTITTPATAGAVAKGEDVPSTAAGFTVETTSGHRIGAMLELSLEDIATVGTASFEPLLRSQISLVVSDELDDQMLNGDGQGNNLRGFFAALADPGAAPTAIADFDAFASAHAGGIDGLWANSLMDVMVLVGPETASLAARTFQSATNYKGEMSASAYAQKNTGGLATNKRMPDPATFLTVTNTQQAILCRKGRSMMPSPTRTAVCPHYGFFSVDDIYTGAAKGQRRFVINTLIGDVILVQPDAYAQIAFKVS